MTWEFQATVSDVIHRVVSDEDEIAWGIEHRGLDEDEPSVLGLAEVALPTGRSTLLLIPPLPGGLILDVIRSYQGLTESELCTLGLGVIDRLRTCTEADSRLSLAAIGLDADGRPSLLPGVRSRLETRPRRALGEMLYHASCGRPWTECLMPVNLALADSSPAVRELVAGLLDETIPDSGLDAAFDEVSAALRRLAPPSALPLIPAERDLAPEQALTARLRAASGFRPERRSEPSAPTASPGQIERSTALSSPSPATRLRAASRRTEGGTHVRRDPLGCLRRVLGAVSGTPAPRSTGSHSGARLRQVAVAAALCLTLLGGVVLARTWATERSDAPASAPMKSRADGIPAAAQVLSEGEITDLLDELCLMRAEALSAGDRTALDSLTVPDSAAAEADELIDVSRFANSDYVIDLEGVEARSITAKSIVAAARMTASAERAGETTRFPPQHIEFTLTMTASGWKVEQVREIEIE